MKSARKPAVAGHSTVVPGRTLLIVIAGVLLAYWALANALGNIGSGRALPLVPRAIGITPAGELRSADLAFFADPKKNGSAAESAALKLLERQPIEENALRLIGYVRGTQSSLAAGLPFIDLSLAVTRRNILGHLYLASVAFEEQRYDEAMRRFDVAMRVSSKSAIVVAPLLGKMLRRPSIQASFAKSVRRDPVWLPQLLNQQLASGADLSGLAQALALAGGLPKRQGYDDLRSQLLANLVVQKHFAIALALYLQAPGSDSDVLTTPAINAASVDQRIAPIGWVLVNSAQVVASPRSGGGGNAINISVSGANGSQALQKILYLRPGSYRWTSEIDMQALGGSVTIAWHVSCLDKGAGGQIAAESFALSAGRQTTAFVFQLTNCETVGVSAYVTGERAEFELRKPTISRMGS